MKPLRDPEGAELKHLLAACELTSKVALEIGCGDGAFARQYARITRRLVGIDPVASDLQIAMKKARSKRLLYLQGQGEQLPFSSQTFDIAIFASSL
jgi:ubiquinone/menaquinone biosynthesis C-methylase UbiE